MVHNSSPTKMTRNPSTIIVIQDPLLLDELEKTDLLSYCYATKLRPASIDELVHLHSNRYIHMIVSDEKNNLNISNRHLHIHYHSTPFFNARLSAGITIDVIQNVLDSHKNDFILLTSPGHCAWQDRSNETSIYNNIALAISSVLMNKSLLDKRKRSLSFDE